LKPESILRETAFIMPITSRTVARIAACSLVAYLGIWAFFHVGADESAGATLLLFGPRWIVALPLLVLVPLAIYVRSYWAGLLCILSGLIITGPIMGGTISVGPLFGSDRPALTQLRIVSWNMDGIKVGPAFRHFLDQTRPTILVCQESGLAADELPAGWKVLGESGNRVATQLPMRFDGFLNFHSLGVSGRLDRFILETPDGQIILIDLHLPTPRPGIEAAIRSKFRDFSELRRMIEIRAEASRIARAWVGSPTQNMIMVGDFNTPVESRIYRANWSEFRNAYSEAGNGWGTTKQTRWFGTRIDHVLFTASWRCRKVWVGPAMGSDHRPLIADLALEDY
jgi:vancomycin resistance protein VanJ